MNKILYRNKTRSNYSNYFDRLINSSSAPYTYESPIKNYYEKENFLSRYNYY